MMITFLEDTDKQKLLVLAVLALSLGFLIGSLQHETDLISWANNSDSTALTEHEEPERPDEAIQTAKQIETAINYASQRVRPAVVSIITRTRVRERGFPFQDFPGFDDPFFERFFQHPFERDVENLGSGIIVDSDGYILTNRHVVEKADKIEVELEEGTEVEAEVKAVDPHNDLAVIKVDKTGLPTAEFGDSDRVKVGEWAIAIGAPFQYRDTVNVGHISALHRTIGIGQYEDLIQTDAAINPGNSGGPLVNIEGEVIGVNTAIATDGTHGNVGIGFAISGNMAQRTARDLIEYGHPKRPWLGVVIQQLTPELAEQFDHAKGVLIAEVAEESPAEEAGFRHGDLILEFNDEPVDSPSALQRKVLARDIGEQVSILIAREDEKKEITVTLGEVPIDEEVATVEPEDPTEPEADVFEDLGLRLEEVPAEEAAEQYNISPARPVLKITEIDPASPAYERGFRENDLIVEVDRRPVESIDEFRSFLERQIETGATDVLLLVQHRGNYYWRVLPLPR